MKTVWEGNFSLFDPANIESNGRDRRSCITRSPDDAAEEFPPPYLLFSTECIRHFPLPFIPSIIALVTKIVTIYMTSGDKAIHGA
jgi:hypothetical protein